MACGCSRSKSYTEANPLVLADETGDPPTEFRTSIAFMGMKANSTFWATGSGVAPMVSAGWLTPL